MEPSLGQISRDLQITVLSSSFCPFPNPVTDSVQNVTANGMPVNSSGVNQVGICAGAEICFDIPVISADTSLNYTMYWDQTLPGATFVDASNPIVADTVRGDSPVARFCWTPDPGLRGFYFFLLTVEDDACPIPGRTQFTFAINVFDGGGFYVVDVTQLGCNEVEFSVAPDPGLPFTPAITNVNWYGNGNLEFNPNTNSTTFNHFYPEPGQYFYSVDVDNVIGCANTITGIVDIATGTVANAGENVTICSNEPLTLGTPARPGVTYSWNPATSLSDPNIAQPSFNFPNLTNSAVTFDYVLTASDGTCTTFDYISVTVNPSLEALLTPSDPQICLGDSITLTAIPNIGADSTSQFLWNTGDTTSAIRVSPSSNTTYSVVVFSDSAGGCSSLPQTIEVEIIDTESATISGDLQVCVGESTTLTASGGTSYQWSTGSTLNTISIPNITSDTTVSVVPLNALGCPGTPATVTVSNNESPVAAFSTGSVCEGATTSFTDNSSISNGQIVSWNWDFGDGDVSNQQNPDHRYLTPGTFTVTLVVRSAAGCEATFSRPVIVSPKPEVDFDLTSVCEGLNNTFTSTSTIASGNLISFNWDFGDGVEDIGPQTQHTYNTHGFYNVTLMVTSEEGCVGSFVKAAVVHALPEPQFALSNTCEGFDIQFQDQSTVPGGFDVINNWTWNYSDPQDPNAGSTDQNPVYSYGESGSFFPSLTVTTDKGCTASTQQEISIFETPTAGFSFNQSCENLPVTYSASVDLAANTQVLNYTWDLGNGDVFEGNNISSVVTRYDVKGGPGTYDIQLIIPVYWKLPGYDQQSVVINPAPDADFSTLPVCLFDSSRFTDISTIGEGSSIVEWLYEFGDGKVSTAPNPNHFYFEPGDYNVRLTVVSDSGCTNIQGRGTKVYALPSFSLIQQDTVCFSEQARLIAVSQPSSDIFWYYEENGGEAFQEGNSFITPTLPYTQTYYVEAVSPNGCLSDRLPVRAVVRDAALLDLVISDSVLEMPQAVVDFNIATNVPIEEYSWDFGDGNTSISSAPSHEYSFPGRFKVTVNIEDTYGCPEELVRLIEVKRRSEIMAPTAFSPNNDSNNDFFRVGTYNISEFNIKIFNRLGIMVYESNDPGFAWNGITNTNRPADQGVYVYVVSGRDLEGNQVEEARTLTLIR